MEVFVGFGGRRENDDLGFVLVEDCVGDREINFVGLVW